MQLNPYIAKFLEAYEPEELKLLVDWLEPDSGDSEEETQRLKEEPSPMNTHLSLVPNNRIKLNDLIELSLINEFGPDFSGTACFKWLSNCISRRFTTETSTQ